VPYPNPDAAQTADPCNTQPFLVSTPCYDDKAGLTIAAEIGYIQASA